MKRGRTLETITARLAVLCLALLLALAAAVPAATAAGGDRTLYLYYTHTKETGKFTFRNDGRHDPKVLSQLNTFLRDWRRNEPAKMDPALYDLVWQVYQDVRATGPIYIVSAYRSPATNKMLRSKSSGVAENSRHTQGMAMDFYIPGVSLSKLREAAMKRQVGGVGYYPASGSPFVHLDTGNVRAWPRMTKAQLTNLFPNGQTLHLPAEGNTPLSSKGYQIAKAEWSKCRTVPCSGRTATSTFAVAEADSAGGGKTLMDWIFGNEESDEGAVDAANMQAPAMPSPMVVASLSVAPPVPASRPAGFYRQTDTLPFGFGGDPLVAQVDLASLSVPVPQPRPAGFAIPAADRTATFTVASINPGAQALAPTPAQPLPQVPSSAFAPVLAGYAPVSAPEPDAQKALEMLLERRAVAKPAPEFNTTSYRSGLNAVLPDTTTLTALISGTLKTVGSGAGLPEATPVFAMRTPDLVAPDLDHVAELFVDPNFLTSDHYAILIDHDGADFSPATELGALAPRLTIGGDPAFGLGRSSFSRNTPRLVATR